MYRKIILLVIASCINADHLNTELLPPDLPPANVANIFHESGITFVSPTTRNLEISSSVLVPPLPITHAFGFIPHISNGPQQLVRTHSSQQVTQEIHSSISALNSANGIHSNVNGKVEFHRHADDNHSPQIAHNVHVSVQPPLTDLVQARFVENENHALHEIDSRTQHFEYKVPLPQTFPQQVLDHHQFADSKDTKHVEFKQRNGIVEHSTYGVPSNSASQNPSVINSDAPSFIPSHVSLDEPTFIPSQDEIDALPVFQNDKFLSPVIRHTKTPTTQSNFVPPAQTIENIFDTTFHSNSPITRTRVNSFDPSTHSTNNPTTRTRENIIGGNNQYTNRFSLSDGTKVSEQGKLISPAVGWENVIAKTGEYEYISPEGIPVRVKWVADHEGFRVLN